MKKTIVIIILGGIIAVFACTHKQQKGGYTQNAPGMPNAFCDSASSDSPCSVLPYDVKESFGIGYTSFLDSIHQPPFDVFSWQTFIALNWPSDTAGRPIGNSISGNASAPRVWEHYQDPAEVFGSNTGELTLRLGTTKKSGQKFFYMDAKAPQPLLNGKQVDINKLSASNLKGFQEADGLPLVDRNLNFALYEIKMNPVETQFTIKNNLTTAQGIYTYGLTHNNAINLPASDSSTHNAGSMEIKASWRILIPNLGDDTSRYYCRRATIYIDSAHTRNHKPLLLTNVQVGLVGMHIIRKTNKLNQFEIWSTFEHIDNTPDDAQQAQQTSRQWSFYNPLCLNCTPNAAPDTLAGDKGQYVWETTMPYARKYGVRSPGQTSSSLFGTQSVRAYPIYKYTQLINDLWQQKLQGTVWANYRLAGSQWRKSDNPTNPVTAPAYLANTTMETYIQNTASCIDCHNHAAVQFKGATITTNLSFIYPVYAKGNSSSTKK